MQQEAQQHPLRLGAIEEGLLHLVHVAQEAGVLALVRGGEAQVDVRRVHGGFFVGEVGLGVGDEAGEHGLELRALDGHGAGAELTEFVDQPDQLVVLNVDSGDPCQESIAPLQRLHVSSVLRDELLKANEAGRCRSAVCLTFVRC